jgi:hypothetical protein
VCEVRDRADSVVSRRGGKFSGHGKWSIGSVDAASGIVDLRARQRQGEEGSWVRE